MSRTYNDSFSSSAHPAYPAAAAVTAQTILHTLSRRMAWASHAEHTGTWVRYFNLAAYRGSGAWVRGLKCPVVSFLDSRYSTCSVVFGLGFPQRAQRFGKRSRPQA